MFYRNKILKILIVICVLIFFSGKCKVLAVENIELSASKQTAKKGEEIEISVNIPNTTIVSLTLQIYFDMTKLEYVNKTENSNFSNNRVIYTWTDVSNENNSGKIEKFYFKTIQNGTANIVITGEFYDRSGNRVEFNDENIQIQIGEDTKPSEIQAQSESEVNDKQVSSDNTDLKVMRLSHVGISPEFQKDIEEYYFIADMNIDDLEVTAIPENINSTVIVTGNTNLKQGLNTIKINVKSEDKTKEKVYKIYITKTANKELANSNLENLAVREGMLIPPFYADITHYNIEVSNTVSKLDILAIPQSMNAKVTIEGNDNLNIGDNTITVNVEAEDEITNKKYVITAHRRNEQEEIEETKEQENQKQQLSAVLANENKNQEENGENKNNKTDMNKTNMQMIDIITLVLLGMVVIGFIVGLIMDKRKQL